MISLSPLADLPCRLIEDIAPTNECGSIWFLLRSRKTFAYNTYGLFIAIWMELAIH